MLWSEVEFEQKRAILVRGCCRVSSSDRPATFSVLAAWSSCLGSEGGLPIYSFLLHVIVRFCRKRFEDL